jgi:hypothetical protein
METEAGNGIPRMNSRACKTGALPAELHAHALTDLILNHFSIFCLTLHLTVHETVQVGLDLRDRAQWRVQYVSENKEWHFVMRILGASAAYAESRGTRF